MKTVAAVKRKASFSSAFSAKNAKNNLSKSSMFFFTARGRGVHSIMPRRNSSDGFVVARGIVLSKHQAPSSKRLPSGLSHNCLMLFWCSIAVESASQAFNADGEHVSGRGQR